MRGYGALENEIDNLDNLDSSKSDRQAKRPNREDIYVSAHVDDCLICCKSADLMAKFKEEFLRRFQGTDLGKVKEYRSGMRSHSRSSSAHWQICARSDGAAAPAAIIMSAHFHVCLCQWCSFYTVIITGGDWNRRSRNKAISCSS